MGWVSDTDDHVSRALLLTLTRRGNLSEGSTLLVAETFVLAIHQRPPKPGTRDLFKVIEPARFHTRDCGVDQMACATSCRRTDPPVWCFNPTTSTRSRDALVRRPPRRPDPRIAISSSVA